MTDEIEGGRILEKALLHAKEQSKNQKKARKNGNEKLCFVITKNKSNSWADDLYACGRIADLNRVYH